MLFILLNNLIHHKTFHYLRYFVICSPTSYPFLTRTTTPPLLYVKIYSISPNRNNPFLNHFTSSNSTVIEPPVVRYLFLISHTQDSNIVQIVSMSCYSFDYIYLGTYDYSCPFLSTFLLSIFSDVVFSRRSGNIFKTEKETQFTLPSSPKTHLPVLPHYVKILLVRPMK